MLLYLAKRNPDPRFRPVAGEVILMALIMLAGSAGLAYVFQGMFKANDIQLRSDTSIEPARSSGEGGED